jgi:hypothetical protein
MQSLARSSVKLQGSEGFGNALANAEIWNIFAQAATCPRSQSASTTGWWGANSCRGMMIQIQFRDVSLDILYKYEISYCNYVRFSLNRLLILTSSMISHPFLSLKFLLDSQCQVSISPFESYWIIKTNIERPWTCAPLSWCFSESCLSRLLEVKG